MDNLGKFDFPSLLFEGEHFGHNMFIQIFLVHHPGGSPLIDEMFLEFGKVLFGLLGTNFDNFKELVKFDESVFMMILESFFQLLEIALIEGCLNPSWLIIFNPNLLLGVTLLLLFTDILQVVSEFRLFAMQK